MIQPEKIFSFTELVRGENKISAQWELSPSCPYLAGHFPQFPVMPAVGLLDGSRELMRFAGMEQPAETLHLRRAKFLGMVQPGQKVSLVLQRKENSVEVEWRKRESGEMLASFVFGGHKA